MIRINFQECRKCRVVPGSPTLCTSCQHNRATINQLCDRIEQAEFDGDELWKVQRMLLSKLAAQANYDDMKSAIELAVRLIESGRLITPGRGTHMLLKESLQLPDTQKPNPSGVQGSVGIDRARPDGSYSMHVPGPTTQTDEGTTPPNDRRS